jgi:hypothetical protein
VHARPHTHAIQPYRCSRYSVDLPNAICPAGAAEAVSYMECKEGCLAPFLLQMLEGVRRVPIFPKGGNRGDKVLPVYSTLTACYDSAGRLVLFAPKKNRSHAHKGKSAQPKYVRRYHAELAEALSLRLDIGEEPPSTKDEACLLSADGRGAVCVTVAQTRARAKSAPPANFMPPQPP